MSRRGDPIRVVVRSRRVPVALTEFELPSYPTLYGLAHRVRRRSIAYEYVLEKEERQILEEVRHAAERSGVGFEVVDLARAGPLSRIFKWLLHRTTERPGMVSSRNQIPCPSGLAC